MVSTKKRGVLEFKLGKRGFKHASSAAYIEA